jgi:hypothetical protein
MTTELESSDTAKASFTKILLDSHQQERSRFDKSFNPVFQRLFKFPSFFKRVRQGILFRQ